MSTIAPIFKEKRHASSHEKRGRSNTTRDTDTFDVASFARDSGFRDDVIVYFYNHHKAHSLPTLFYTDWDDALMITADGGGDNINHSRRRLLMVKSRKYMAAMNG